MSAETNIAADPKQTKDESNPPPDALLRQAMRHHKAGNLGEAAAAYQAILRQAPRHPDALHLLGLVAHQSGEYRSALRLINQSLALYPRNAAAYSNRGNTLRKVGRVQSALEDFDQAIALDPAYAEAYYNRGALLQELSRPERALADYDRAIALDLRHAALYNNRGNVLKQLHRLREAVESFDVALRLNPRDADALSNRAAALYQMRQFKSALASCDHAIQLSPNHAGAHCNRGIILFELGEYPEALQAFDRALALRPGYEYLDGMRLHLKRLCCDWEGIEAESKKLMEKVAEGRKVITPLNLLAISDSAQLQRKAAEIYARDQYAAVSRVALPRHAVSKKIRIGYFSADFREHPISRLLVEPLELRNRDEFEITGFSFGPDTKDAMQLRISAAMDRFLDIRSLSDAAAACLSRELEIDIAVDLMGHTLYSRNGIFAERAAPVQISYLGYPGTSGAEYIDYLIADEVLIPPSHRKFYSEKILSLPGCFQANPSRPSVPLEVRSRSSQGLPENGFVYCCFNHNYKISPELFTLWMRILSRVEGSVLWLLADNPWAADHLRREATRRGVSADRLVFAQRTSFAEHIARQQLADLFLDTYPFNAGATASPALGAGLPLVTLRGESFAGRMAASLLRTVDLPELITATPEAYENLAVELALDPGLLHAIKSKLQQNLLKSSLFDPLAFIRKLEDAFRAVHTQSVN